jgi:hypothetical protein
MKHESGGVEDSESVFFIEQDGAFDLKPVEPSTKTKENQGRFRSVGIIGGCSMHPPHH